MKYTKLLAMSFLLVSFPSFSQTYNVKWSELMKSEGRMLGILPRDANDFFALRRSGRGGLFSKLQVSAHKNLESMGKGKLELRANGSPAIYEGSAIVNDRFVVFLSDKKDGRNEFFMQEYSSSLEPKGKVQELAGYSIEGKKKRFSGEFSVVQSLGRDHFAVLWTIPGRREEQTTYGYKVFDGDLELINEGEYELPFQTKFSTINSFYLSNTGDLFMNVTEYKESEKKGLFKSYKNYKSVHIYHITPDGLEDMEINLEGKRVEAMALNSDNDNTFIITGIYGAKDSRGVTGMFYLKADFKKQEILTEGFEEFSDDFILQTWSDKQQKKYARKKAKGKEVEPELFNYEMREVHVMPDGSVVGSMEQYYVRVVSNYNAQTNTYTYTYYYYYNDIVAFKVGADGGFDWLTRIDKYQVSTNDGGFCSSYCRFVDQDRMCFLFNDNSDNYDEVSDKFVDDGKVKSARLSKKKNTVAVCEVNLEDGSVERKMFFDRSELGAIAVPRLFNVDYINNEVLLYAVKGSKEKFGILNFGD